MCLYLGRNTWPASYITKNYLWNFWCFHPSRKALGSLDKWHWTSSCYPLSLKRSHMSMDPITCTWRMKSKVWILWDPIGVVTPLSSHSQRSKNAEVAPSPWMAEGPFSENGKSNFSSSTGEEWRILGEGFTACLLFLTRVLFFHMEAHTYLH